MEFSAIKIKCPENYYSFSVNSKLKMEETMRKSLPGRNAEHSNITVQNQIRSFLHESHLRIDKHYRHIYRTKRREQIDD
jgi:hypothetical protein